MRNNKKKHRVASLPRLSDFSAIFSNFSEVKYSADAENFKDLTWLGSTKVRRRLDNRRCQKLTWTGEARPSLSVAQRELLNGRYAIMDSEFSQSAKFPEKIISWEIFVVRKICFMFESNITCIFHSHKTISHRNNKKNRSTIFTRLGIKINVTKCPIRWGIVDVHGEAYVS